MAISKYYNFTKIFGEEMDALLIMFKNLTSSKKITDNLPDDVNSEINTLNNRIDNYQIDSVSGGGYLNELIFVNLVKDGSFENISMWTTWLASPTDSTQSKYGQQSLKLGGNTLNGDALASIKIDKPIVGHKYYGREWIKTNGELTADDCRFEIISTDITPEEPHVFGWNRGNYPDWTMISNIITIPYANADSYIVRTFTVGGSVEAWVDGLMIIDLTATFGEGNEPSKEWCDTNIPFFKSFYRIGKQINLINILPSIDGNKGFNTGVSSATHTKYSNNALLLEGNTSVVEVGATSVNAYPLNSAHTYYARVEIYQEEIVGSTDFYFPIAEPNFYSGIKVVEVNKWTIASKVTNRSSFTDGNYQFRLDFNNAYNTGKMWFDGVMLIDLTEAFGEGYEPTKEWCDTNISYFVGSWDGCSETTTIES